jgi:phenylalanyl-tRNA synthetase beta chain
MKISYNWLQELVPITLSPSELAERLTMAGLAVDSIERVAGDHILDFDILSNRPDALSHLGVAREAALVCGTDLRREAVKLEETGEQVQGVASVEILDPDLCPRYAARLVRGVKVGPSPRWLAERLESIGQRSVNNVADITNLVMFEMGQPIHAFDFDLLKRHRIVVRRARSGEQITTLDGFDRELSTEMLVIADAEHPVAVAGVMGGEESEISPGTTNVLIESAYFNPASVRSTARALELDTEASYRFARGVDYDGQVRAADRAAAMIREIAGGQVLRGVIDVYPAPITRDPVPLRVSRVTHLTGLPMTVDRAAKILKGLEFRVEIVERDGGLLNAIVPSFRIDVSREIDLVEEVARHTGYDLIDVTLPAWTGSGSYLPGENGRREIRRALSAVGFNEAVSFSFVNGGRDNLFRERDGRSIALANPIDVDENEMRSSLLTGLLEALQRNINQDRRDVKLFEMGRVFKQPHDKLQPDETEFLALVLSGASWEDDWRYRRPIDFYDMKGAVQTVLGVLNLTGFTIERAGVEYLHPGQSAAVVRDGLVLARFGRLHPRVESLYKFRQAVFVAEIELESLLQLGGSQVRYSALPKLPAASRDVSALLADSVSWGEVEAAIAGLAIKEIVSLKVFDVYRGKGIPEGVRSVSFRVTYRGSDQTLSDEDVAPLQERVREIMQRRFGAQFR